MKKLFLGFFVLFFMSHAMAATVAGGCDDADNDAIAAELALCSTHAYNIGRLDNPSDSEKQLMRDVIAMKTTLVTQQLFNQYEQMDSMLRRLKTQLERAVLTTKLEATGASAESSSGADRFESNDRNIYMAGVQNCLNVYQDDQILKCYEANLNTIITTSGNGANVTTELKKQLAQDYAALAKQDFGGGGCAEPSDECQNKDQNKDKMMSKKDFKDCLDAMKVCLQNQYRKYNAAKNSQKKVP